MAANGFWPRSPALQMAVGELDELLPVVRFDGVAAGSDVVADVAVEQRLVGRRQFGGAQRFFAEQLVHRTGVVCGLKFTVRISPRVRRAAGDINRAGRDERQQHVLIDRQIVFVIVELAGVDAEPVREAVELGHRLAVLPAPQRRSAAAGLCGVGHRESLILCRGPKGGLTHFGMTHHRDSTGIDPVVGFEVVERPHAGPAVGGEYAPLVCLGETLAVAEKQLVDAAAERHLVVAHQVAVIDGNIGVALVNQLAKRHTIAEVPFAA